MKAIENSLREAIENPFYQAVLAYEQVPALPEFFSVLLKMGEKTRFNNDPFIPFFGNENRMKRKIYRAFQAYKKAHYRGGEVQTESSAFYVMALRNGLPVFLTEKPVLKRGFFVSLWRSLFCSVWGEEKSKSLLFYNMEEVDLVRIRLRNYEKRKLFNKARDIKVVNA